jgi:hypothetical protein
MLNLAGRDTDPTIMTDADPVLDRLFARYRAALAAHRSPTPVSADRSLATAEAVIEARVCLYEHLVATGWEAPPEVRQQLRVDALLLEQPPTAMAG